MKNSFKFSTEQAISIGYTKWEKALGASFIGLIMAIIATIGSFALLPFIVKLLIPDSDRGFLPLTLTIPLFGMVISIGVGVLCVISTVICGFVLGTKSNPKNSHRMRPLVINSYVSGLTIIIALASTFIDYAWYRSEIAIIAIGVSVISIVVSYCVYYKRYRQDIAAVTHPTNQNMV